MDICDRYDPQTTVVLVVDMQHGYCSPDGESIRRRFIKKEDAKRISSDFVPRLAAFLKEARVYRFQIIHAYVENVGYPRENKFIPGCGPQTGEEMFRRFDAAKIIFDGEGYQNFLLFGGSHIERFIIVGVYFDACVERHARRAREFGYEVIVPPDLTYP